MTEQLSTVLRERMIRHLVQRKITCPVTGKVLDVRTCTVISDEHGIPEFVYAPEVGQRLSNNPELVADFERAGYQIDTRKVDA